MDNMIQNMGGMAAPAVPAAEVRPVIGIEQIQKAQQILLQYKSGKKNLEQQVIENERWYRQRHWEVMRKSGKSEVEPTSGWLFNALQNKHADAMDNFPRPNILPREQGDQAEAKKLKSILPVVLDQADFENVYDKVQGYKLRTGTGIYGVFWDANKLGGLGDVSIRKIDILNLYWESGITDIQDSRNVFCVELVDNGLLEELYPQCRGKLGGSLDTTAKYEYDDTVDTTRKSAVVDWYYKKHQDGNTVLHYCKYVGDTVLFATENDPEYASKGWYDHGQYPFIFDPLFERPGSPCGFGYIDVAKSAQEYIDRGNQAILKNLLANAAPRHFIRSDGAVNEEEYADYTREFVHVDGNLGQDSILPVQGKPLSSIYVNVIENKVEELKEITGNRDVSNGGSTSGVTAASAIAAMQEAGSKLSRANIKASYRAYKKLCLMVIELIRQFYSLPRCFRIMGEQGAMEYIYYSNAEILPQQQPITGGMDMGMRLPVFDVEVVPEKASAYSRLSQNELALQFYSAGFFNPAMADQALACLDMMDFDRKGDIMQKIQVNAMQYRAMMMGVPTVPPVGGAPVQGAAENQSALGGTDTGESPVTKDARERVANSTSPT